MLFILPQKANSEVTPIIQSTNSEVVQTIEKYAGSKKKVVMEVARCESSLRQFDEHGNVLRGKVNSKDVGVMQINEMYHLEESKKLGYDIYTVEGNIQYGLLLIDKQGLKPWQASKHCWGSQV